MVSKLIFVISGLFSATCYSIPTVDKVKQCKEMFYQVKKGQESIEYLTPCPLSQKLALWLKLIDETTKHDFGEIVDFIQKNPEWPYQYSLQNKAESQLTLDYSDHKLVLSFFKKYPPRTPRGKILYGQFLLKDAPPAQAMKYIREAWATSEFSSDQEASFLKVFSSHLDEMSYFKRAQNSLWKENVDGAKAILKFLSKGHAAVIRARIALQTQSNKAELESGAIPQNLKNDPGLQYERVRARRKKNQNDGAIQLLNSIPLKAQQANFPDKWWTERHILARRAMAQKNFKKAYAIAKDFAVTEGPCLAEALGLCGWLALEFGKNPKVALMHFKRMDNFVQMPLSKAKAAYFAGKACKHLGKNEDALKWFQKGSLHKGTFYGQLCLENIGKISKLLDKTSFKEPKVPRDKAKRFFQRELVQVVYLMREYKEKKEIPFFFYKMGQTIDDPHEHALLIDFAALDGDVYLGCEMAVQLGKKFQHMINAAYPTIKAPTILPADRALVNAIIRKESRFNPGGTSDKGARGMMQLLPTTAQEVALKEGLTLEDIYHPEKNVLIGSHYIKQLIRQYDGSIVLALAAYNAGPRNVAEWLGDYGDPRKGEISFLDWIECIPFSQTRDYVMRVMETYMVYRHLLNSGLQPLSTLLKMKIAA